MNQPELGLKVAELRSQKKLTQEQLAEKCEVSPRTIQRIEGGEVDPRAYTLHCLSEALDFDFGADEASSENVWLVVLHLSSIFCVLLFIPLLIWSWKKTHSYKIDTQGREVLNFQITMTLLLLTALLVLPFVPALFITLANAGVDPGLQIGVAEVLIICASMILVPLGLFCFHQGVTNAIRALTDRPIRYLLSIPFVK
jgi:uncharacterized Tic20 family protein/DNA-binding Xre family transcriptional regulator